MLVSGSVVDVFLGLSQAMEVVSYSSAFGDSEVGRGKV